MRNILKILISGEGGQGVQSVAKIMADAAHHENKEVLYIPNFGVEQRGGISMAFLQIADRGRRIGAPKFSTADLLVALSPRAIERTRSYVQEDTLYIYDNSLIQAAQVNDQIIGLQYFDTQPPCPADLPANKAEEKETGDPKSCWYPQDKARQQTSKPPGIPKQVLPIAANDIAKNELQPRVFNVLILGVIAALTNVVSQEGLEKTLLSTFKGKPELQELNKKALQRGYELAPSK